MIQLFDKGAYVFGGNQVVSEEAISAEYKKYTEQLPVQEECRKNSLGYQILAAHNTSGNMEQLKIKFDKLTSHDITFVGIIQTARASGLEKFPVPYVLTNCHNSLCAVGGTINEDDH
ncbi:MAG: hydratase, partial [Lachnospiraceae bacterium]|nr:hydratase [Lachnospiraceae bacterium]